MTKSDEDKPGEPPGPAWTRPHPRGCSKSHDICITDTRTHAQRSGLKWWRKSLCHGSMMNHYGRVTHPGKQPRGSWDISVWRWGRKGEWGGVGSRKGESRSQRCSYLSPVLSVFFILCELSRSFTFKTQTTFVLFFVFVSFFQLFLLHPQRAAERGNKTLNHRHEEHCAARTTTLWFSWLLFSPSVKKRRRRRKKNIQEGSFRGNGKRREMLSAHEE